MSTAPFRRVTLASAIADADPPIGPGGPVRMGEDGLRKAVGLAAESRAPAWAAFRRLALEMDRPSPPSPSLVEAFDSPRSPLARQAARDAFATLPRLLDDTGNGRDKVGVDVTLESQLLGRCAGMARREILAMGFTPPQAEALLTQAWGGALLALGSGHSENSQSWHYDFCFGLSHSFGFRSAPLECERRLGALASLIFERATLPSASEGARSLCQHYESSHSPPACAEWGERVLSNLAWELSDPAETLAAEHAGKLRALGAFVLAYRSCDAAQVRDQQDLSAFFARIEMIDIAEAIGPARRLPARASRM